LPKVWIDHAGEVVVEILESQVDVRVEDVPFAGASKLEDSHATEEEKLDQVDDVVDFPEDRVDVKVRIKTPHVGILALLVIVKEVGGGHEVEASVDDFEEEQVVVSVLRRLVGDEVTAGHKDR
jgi:hypothetical protein